MDIIHVGLISGGSWNFIFLDEIWVDMAASAGSGKVERIDPRVGVSFFLDVMPSVTIVALRRLMLARFLRQPVDAPLISPVRIRMTARTPGSGESGFGLNLMGTMAARTGRNGSMNTPRQSFSRLFTVARSTVYCLHLLRMRNLARLRVTIPTGKISMSGPGQLLRIDREQGSFSPVNHPGDFGAVTS